MVSFTISHFGLYKPFNVSVRKVAVFPNNLAIYIFILLLIDIFYIFNVYNTVDTHWNEEHQHWAHMLRDEGWFTFFKKIKGYNVEVSQEFARKFMDT